VTQDPTQQRTVPTGPRTIAGRYALLEEIGRGGMGIVWLAEDRTIGRRVAIKELHLPAGVPDKERAVLEERVLREARTAGRLNDPGVVTVYDVVREEPGGTYIVMELIQAPTLSDIVRLQGAQSPEFVVRLAEQLLSALEAAHAAGVVHRDVKPSNVMVLPNGRVKLTDFGIAQTTDDPGLTTTGILVGSPTYIAPERVHGAEADARSDLWALAAVLFYAVEGYSPFERSSTAATMHAILNEVPYLTRVHGPLASVIMGLLNVVPEARLSAAQVRDLLGRVTHTPPGGLNATSHLPPVGYSATALHTAPNHRPPGSGARRMLFAVLAVALAAGLFVGGFFTHRAMRPAAEDDRPANQDSTLTYGRGGKIPELTLNSYPQGNCLTSRLDEGQRITGGAQVECTEPHDLQFYEWRTLFAQPTEYETFPDAGYPDVADMTEYAERICTMAFDSELVSGDDSAKQTLRYRALIPTKAAWDTDRELRCVLYRADGDQLTESYIASK